MKILLTTLIALIAAYLFLLVVARWFSHIIIFPAPAPSYVKGSEHIFMPFGDGSELAGIFLPAKDSQYCILYCHGNGEDLGMIDGVLRAFRARGISIFAYDYPGYGLSGGEPREEKLYKSADIAWNYVRNNLGYAEDKIVVMGYSLGSAPASYLAQEHPGIRALILAGGVSQGVEVILPWNIIPWDILNNAGRIEKIVAPILLIHGAQDSIVPPRNARNNFAAAKGKAKLVWLEQTGHLDMLDNLDYLYEVLKFIENPDHEKGAGNTI